MIQILFIIFIYFLTPALSSECLRYTFEKDYQSLFRLCPSNPSVPAALFWYPGNYDTIGVTSYDELSNSFISPQSQHSCVWSFEFPMAHDGTIEVIAYMSNVSEDDLIGVIAYQITDDNDVDRALGNVLLTPRGSSDFKEGWHSLKFKLSSSTTSNGYVSYILYHLLTIIK